MSQIACNSYKVELLQAVHNFTATTGDTFKMALYTAASTISAATTVYTATNEASGPGYTAGGVVLTTITPVLVGTVGVATFYTPFFPAVTLTFQRALIYNSSKANRAVAVFDFGAPYTVSGGNLEILMPPANATNAIIRVT